MQWTSLSGCWPLLCFHKKPGTLSATITRRFWNARQRRCPLRCAEARCSTRWLMRSALTRSTDARSRTTAERLLTRRAISGRPIGGTRWPGVSSCLESSERTAAKALSQHGALDRLLATTDATATDRRLLGLLAAMDRMEMARGLPKQLKFYALGHVLTTVFDVAPPPTDALKPTAIPVPGTWLAYLSGVASRAGYPASDSPALTHKMRETLAWTGVGHGFADRLRRQVAALPNAAVPELSRIATEVATRLEKERATAETMSKRTHRMELRNDPDHLHHGSY